MRNSGLIKMFVMNDSWMSSSKQDNYNTKGETRNTEENGKIMKTGK